MKITIEWLREMGACEFGARWFLSQFESEHQAVIKALIKDGKYSWANWTVAHVMAHPQRVQYACYAAKQCLHVFEKAYPNDKRPREAIIAAMRWVKNPTEANKSAVRSARTAAAGVLLLAGWAVESARSAVLTAAWAVESARSAMWATESVRSAVLVAGVSESAVTYKKILQYGLRLTKGA